MLSATEDFMVVKVIICLMLMPIDNRNLTKVFGFMSATPLGSLIPCSMSSLL
jgi:hypothetical protein